MKLGVRILPRPEVLDSQGRTIMNHLIDSGFKIQDCKIGKLIILESQHTDYQKAENEVKKIAEEILCNPLIETYQIEKLS